MLHMVNRFNEIWKKKKKVKEELKRTIKAPFYRDITHGWYFIKVQQLKCLNILSHLIDQNYVALNQNTVILWSILISLI